MKRADLERRNRELLADLDRLKEALQSASLRRLVTAYAWLEMAEHPMPGRTLGGTGGTPRDVDRPMPGAATFRYRSLKQRVDRNLRRQAAEIEAALHGEWPDPPKGRRCPDCGKGSRFGSKFCDRCGTQLVDKKATR